MNLCVGNSNICTSFCINSYKKYGYTLKFDTTNKQANNHQTTKQNGHISHTTGTTNICTAELCSKTKQHRVRFVWTKGSKNGFRIWRRFWRLLPRWQKWKIIRKLWSVVVLVCVCYLPTRFCISTSANVIEVTIMPCVLCCTALMPRVIICQ